MTSAVIYRKHFNLYFTFRQENVKSVIYKEIIDQDWNPINFFIKFNLYYTIPLPENIIRNQWKIIKVFKCDQSGQIWNWFESCLNLSFNCKVRLIDLDNFKRYLNSF